MKLIKKSLGALFVCALMCAPVLGQSVTVVDFGAFQDGGNVYTPFSGTVESGDPAIVTLQQNNAGTAQVDNPVVSTALAGGGTLTWTNVSAWNNGIDGVNPGETFFLNRQTDALDTFFEVATANPTDLVTIDFVGGVGRTASIDLAGVNTIVPATGAGAGPFSWTNVGTDLLGTQTGELSPELDISGEEGNVGAIRVTITPGAVVPEPTSLALLGLAGCGLAVRRRRK